MAEGVRDQFVENDIFGNTDGGAVALFGVRRSGTRKARRKNRRVTRHRSTKSKSSNRRPKFGSPAWFAKYKPHSHRRKHRRKKRKK